MKEILNNQFKNTKIKSGKKNPNPLMCHDAVLRTGHYAQKKILTLQIVLPPAIARYCLAVDYKIMVCSKKKPFCDTN